MKRLRLWLFRGLFVVSVLVFIAFTVEAIRSYWVDDYFSWNSVNNGLMADAGGGQFRFEFDIVTSSYWQDPTGFHHSTDKEDGPLEDGERLPGSRQWFKGGGFWLVTGERWGDYHYAIFFPAWFVCGLFLLPTAFVLRKRIRRTQLPPTGLCVLCGYDLRATPDRCPECGIVPAKA
jgi:hypothetical protein